MCLEKTHFYAIVLDCKSQPSRNALLAIPENASLSLLATSPSDCDVAAAAVPFDPELCRFGSKQNQVWTLDILLFLKMLRTTVLAVKNTPLTNIRKEFRSEMSLEVAWGHL